MILIGICGPSNSGKSSLCGELVKKYDAEWIEVDHTLKIKKRFLLKGNIKIGSYLKIIGMISY